MESRKPKHILVVSQYYSPEPFRIHDICAELVKRGYKVTVLTGIPNYPEGKFYPGYGLTKRRRETVDGVEVIRIPIIPRGSRYASLALNYLSFVVSGFFWQLFTRLEADAVFSLGLSPVFQALVGVWYAQRKKIPHYLYVQDLWPESFEMVTGIHHPLLVKPLSKLVSYVYERCHKIFGTSPSYVEAIRGRVRTNRERVVCWPQYAESFYVPLERKPVPEIPDDGSFKVIFTGNVGQAQGLDILPSAAQKLKQRGASNVRFVIVGDGRYREQMGKEIAAAAVEEMFTMVDRQPAQRIPALLAACDAAFVSFADNPLFEKAIPAKLQSYMACGMPIVAVARGETERVVREAQCGVCSPIGDSEALAENIVGLMASAQLAVQAVRARSYFEDHFEKKKLMDVLETFLQGS